ncbi:hypothetical protein H9P43_009595 [Blastocladiella emersonii ATCC 22665]|nr:hypothetical protein H9P43_009595 [Blastocladiella emersonii ATCC 22665]
MDDGLPEDDELLPAWHNFLVMCPPSAVDQLNPRFVAQAGPALEVLHHTMIDSDPEDSDDEYEIDLAEDMLRAAAAHAPESLAALFLVHYNGDAARLAGLQSVFPAGCFDALVDE